MLLAGDIGGTKTNLALYASEREWRTPVAEATFPSANYASLEAVAGEFLKQLAAAGKSPGAIERACFGVAGPVVAGRATITNLPWVIDERQLQSALNIGSAKL